MVSRGTFNNRLSRLSTFLLILLTFGCSQTTREQPQAMPVNLPDTPVTINNLELVVAEEGGALWLSARCTTDMPYREVTIRAEIPAAELSQIHQATRAEDVPLACAPGEDLLRAMVTQLDSIPAEAEINLTLVAEPEGEESSSNQVNVVYTMLDSGQLGR